MKAEKMETLFLTLEDSGSVFEAQAQVGEIFALPWLTQTLQLRESGTSLREAERLPGPGSLHWFRGPRATGPPPFSFSYIIYPPPPPATFICKSLSMGLSPTLRARVGIPLGD